MQTDTTTLGGRYEILEELGLKGVSLVCRGFDRAEEREVSIRRVAPNSRDEFALWMAGREPGDDSRYTESDLVEDAIALASIKHPNFLTIYDYGRDKDGPFVVTEPLQGVILEKTLQKNPLSVQDFISLAKQTLESLSAAHAAGLTGVYLEPWNIMLLRQVGGRFSVKILGLGRSSVGTMPILEAEYPPDQEIAQAANPCCEFLSLGRLYYQALTGFRPFGNVESSLVQGSPAVEKLASCSMRRPDVPREFSDWVMWLIGSADGENGLTTQQVEVRFSAICSVYEKALARSLSERAQQGQGQKAPETLPAAAAAGSNRAGIHSPAVNRARQEHDAAEVMLTAHSDADADTEEAQLEEKAHPAASEAGEQSKAEADLREDSAAESKVPTPVVEHTAERTAPPAAIAAAAATATEETAPPSAAEIAEPPETTTGAAAPEPSAVTSADAEEAAGDRKETQGEGASSKKPKPSTKSSRRKQRRRANAKKRKAAAKSKEISGKEKEATGADVSAPAAAPAEARTGGATVRDGAPHAGDARALAARSGEVPLAGRGGFRRVESHGVFLPAPEHAQFPEGPVAEIGEPRDAVSEIPEIESPQEGNPEAGKPDAAPRHAKPESKGRKEAEKKRLGESAPVAKPAPSETRPMADPLRWDAAESQASGARGWRVPALALAVLCCALAIVLAGSLLKSNSQKGGEGSLPSTAVASTATAAELANPGPASDPVPVAVPAVSVPVRPSGNAESVARTVRELLSDASAAEAQGDDLSAIGQYMNALRSFPRNAEAKAALAAYVDSLADRPPDVIGFLDRALVECAEEHSIGAAMRILGERAMESEHWDQAYQWLSKAAIEKDVPGTRLLGLLLATGKGIDEDLEAAAECFEWAADNGDLRAAYLAGECYVMGKGVEANPEKGIDFLERAAEVGDLRAIDLMGVCHARGLGTEVDFKKALGCFREAVEGGYPAALANLGVLYIQGQGVKQDAAAAVEYFREGAEADNVTCMVYYAKCLEKGLGVEASRVAAVEWYRKAAAAGNEEAQAWFATQAKSAGN